ncbi:MAG TPA: class IV adenylate cyclase [Gemmataceae bacterium]|nr:class IV adenylate cyclase [Gemmataceae bacterium]
MLEVEAKYPLSDPAAVEARLREWGATLVADHAEADHYLNAPDRDFARTDEAFRLRRIGDRNLLTYKGPRRDGTSKTRTELEVPCPPGDEVAEAYLQLFRHLGYWATAVVRKRRRIYEWARDGFTIHACLDDVEAVGRFIELEIVAEESDLAAARETVTRTAAELQLGPTETRSYLEQLLGRTVPPGGVR